MTAYLQAIPLFIITGALGFLVGAIYTWAAAWSYSENRIRKMIPFNRAIEEYQLDEEYTPATTDKEKAFMKLVEKLKSFQSEMKHSMGREFESGIQNYSEFVAEMADRWQPTTQKNSKLQNLSQVIYTFKPISETEILDKVRTTDDRVLRRYHLTFEEGFKSGRFFEVYGRYLSKISTDGMYATFLATYETVNSIVARNTHFISNIWEIHEFDPVTEVKVRVFIGEKKAIQDAKITRDLETIKIKNNDKSEKGGLPD